MTHGNYTAWYYGTAGPTPTTMSNASGTGTLSPLTPRTHHRLLRRRCSGRLYRHPRWQHDDERPPLHHCSGALHRHPAHPGAVPCKLRRDMDVTDNAAHRPLNISNHSTGKRAPLPSASGAPWHGNYVRMWKRTLSPRETPARPSVSTRPTSTKLAKSDSRDVNHHQPLHDRADDGHNVRGIPMRHHNRKCHRTTA